MDIEIIGHVGMTGSRNGMTIEQQFKCWGLLEFLFNSGSEVFHHGDCIGADKQNHIYANTIGYFIEVHPPKNPKLRAYCKGDIIHEEKEYLVRNKDIVNSSVIILGFPPTETHSRSGTWSTVSYAKKKGKETIVVLPSGQIESFNDKDKILEKYNEQA